jgi:predicted porin
LEKIEMKKTLVAVAAIAAFSAAHAQVTITGVMEAAVAKTSTGTAFGGGTNGGSEFTVGVSEDLGSGLKVFGQTTMITTAHDTDIAYVGVASTAGSSSATNSSTGGSFGSYQNWIGLSGDFGSVKLGQFWSNTFMTSISGDVMARQAFSNQLHGGAQGQIANSVNYTSPTFSGLTANYQRAMDNTVALQQYSSYSVGYSNGAFNASYASGTVGTTVKTKENIIGLNYNFGVATAYVGARTTTITSAASTSGSSYGIAVPFGATTVSVGMGSSGSISNYQALLNYDFSKKTRVYLATANGITAANPVTTQVGIRHNF